MDAGVQAANKITQKLFDEESTPIGAGHAYTVHTPSDILKTSDSPVLVLARHASLPLVKVLLPSGEESWVDIASFAEPTPGLPLYEVTGNQAAYNLKLHGLQYNIHALDKSTRIKVVSKHDESGWWCASLPASTEIFYVKGSLTFPATLQTNNPIAVALYDFDAEAPDELTFREGDRLEIIAQDPSGWWEAESPQGRGYIPSNYVVIQEGKSV